VDAFLFIKWLHVISACVLLGTGAGIAFFMLMAHRTRDVRFIALTASIVVKADMLFTATAAIIQPITGLTLAWQMGWALSEGWIVLSLLLYVFIGVFWLPVVWLQIQLRDLAYAAIENNEALPDRYFRLFRIWFASGFPAFIAILAIVWLMIARPEISIL
jgi:uncharacterized membrane protein